MQVDLCPFFLLPLRGIIETELDTAYTLSKNCYNARGWFHLDNTVIAGVGRGGMTDKYQIKILICYLMSVVTVPFSSEQLNEVFQEAQIVNYFSFCEALNELIEIGHLSVLENGSYELNPLGQETADRLAHSLPKSVRDNVVRTAMQLIAKQKHEQENEVVVMSTEQGFLVTCTIHDLDFDLMQLSLYAPDKIQAEVIRRHFLKDPSGLYQSVIGRLTEPEEF